MKYLIIIPTYNEAKNIKLIVETIIKEVNNYDYSILIIDDNSNDGTKNIICELKTIYNNIYTIERKGKFGLASAYIAGFKFGLDNNFDSLIQMDADFSHNPEYLPVMFNYLSKYDVVIGSRNIKGGKCPDWGIIRNIISKGGSLYSKLILSCKINDLTGGFNAWRSDTVKKINLDSIISKGYLFQIEMKYKACKLNAKIKEFPIVFIDRKYGQSKMSKKIFFEALINIFKIRFQK